MNNGGNAVATSSLAVVDGKPKQPAPETPRRGRKSRQPAEESARYFLGKAGSASAHPELAEEAPNENQALIKAFQQSGVIYVVMSYRVEAEIQGGNPILVKRPLQKQ
jgi:hypothetical protein